MFITTTPVSPVSGDRWFNTDLGREFVYTYDGDSYQWVEIAVSGLLGTRGYDGSVGSSYLPVTTQSTSYVLANSDNGSLISTTANVTINTTTVPPGFNCTIFNNSSGNVTIISNTGTTVYWAGTSYTGNRTLLQRGLATLVCVATSNTFVISGSLV